MSLQICENTILYTEIEKKSAAMEMRALWRCEMIWSLNLSKKANLMLLIVARISAGREVRVIVRPEVVDDLSAIKLARDIATKIESTMQYPGTIKVNVIRETRAVEFAK